MTKAKIAITVDPELLAQIRKLVAHGAAASVSAYIDAAVAEKLATDDFHVLLAEMLDETGGPLTNEERAWADRILDA